MTKALLQSEIVNDPLSRGYSGMTPEEIHTSLHTKNRNNWVPVSSSQVFEALDPSEFRALTNAGEARTDRILGLGNDIQTAPGSNARVELISIFGSTSVTISNLAVVANQQISRAEELGIVSVATVGIIIEVMS